VADRPWDHIEIDLIGPLPTSEHGATYILTVVDVYTAFTVLRTLKTKEMEEVARKLWEIFTDFGTPKILQSDRGLEFVNQVMTALTTLHGIESRLSAAYNPRTNGLVERKNKDISLALKKFIEGGYGGWDDWLPLVQISLNQHIGRRTGFSAFDLMFNRPFNGLSDFQEATEEDLDQMLEKNKEAWTLFRDAVLPGLKIRVTNIKAEQRARMDEHKQVKSLLPGDTVWIKDVTRENKWEPVYEGPFVILQQHKSGNYSLLDSTGAILPRRVPISQIKLSDAGKNDTPSEEGGKDEHYM